MSLKNLLDLSQKPQQSVQIVEKIIIQQRPWYSELFRMFVVMIVASVIIWGVSNASTLIPQNTQTLQNQVKSKSFSAIGLVLEVVDNSLTIDNAKGSDDANTTTYTFDTTNVKKIETKDYSPLTLNDIQIGDKIIVQGIFNDSNDIEIRRIISFGLGTTTPKVEVATSTATTTEEVASTTATTTDASITGTTTTDGATSPSIIDNIINTATTTFQNIVDAITGTSTGTSTPEDTSSTTPETSSTTPDVSSSTPETQTNLSDLNGQAPAPDATPPQQTSAPQNSDGQAAPDSAPASDTPAPPADAPAN